ncbi:type III secretion system export apparatus subunit SctR [Aureimonas leprariae]|uniref:EscR/YscR/HrcR family type III secretion system export apparatus protein n=1 Tax=Plantimonas leprariae TaxID=2615207 RepID=A0A7V7PLB2_9HYPH|nr:type III secretion system export apparatus subunit SctR [Aureimonas leprariae]KAB0676845.1 EscR/YscR/HrcR family type III secretion system export apparatus protein [Aureimonas leprariae]
MVDPLNLILLVAGAALFPFIAVVATSFIKLSVVFLLVRNAIGVQNIPPNMALNALAIILSGYIMAPVVVETYNALSTQSFDLNTIGGVKAAYEAGKGPLTDFLTRHAAMREKMFFLEAARTLWPADMAAQLSQDSIAVVLPAFTVSQLREAFEIGFLLYLPFIAIDLIVSNILLAMGMMMVSPLTISLPFKLFLFVMIDGWSRLILGLVKTYV